LSLSASRWPQLPLLQLYLKTEVAVEQLATHALVPHLETVALRGDGGMAPHPAFTLNDRNNE